MPVKTALSCVIVTHNSAECVSRCLAAVVQQEQGAVETVVVDNASNDGTAGIVRREFPGVPLVVNGVNRGYAAALNQGVCLTGGDWCVVLNADTQIDSDFFLRVREAIADSGSRKVGMFAAKMRDRSGRIDSTGLVLSALRRFYDRGRGRRVDDPALARPADVFGPSGACAVYRRAMLEECAPDKQYFDEDFFMLVEDMDIAWRARRRGWTACYLPVLGCVHRGGISRTRSWQTQYYCLRNRYYLIVKNDTVSALPLLLFGLVCYDLPRMVWFMCVNPRRFDLWKDLWRTMPLMLEKRKRATA